MNRVTVLALVLVLIASARIASTYQVFSFTIDEPAHAACGMEWLDAGVYRYEVQHPPLARVVAGLGLRCAGIWFGNNPTMWYEGARLLGAGQGDRGLVYGRAAMLPFFWIACGVVFLWARRLGNDVAGLIALAIFTSLPPVLAHASLITTDMALTAFTGASFLSAIWWAEAPSPGRAITFGIAAALATLSKFSAIPFLGCAFGLALLSFLLTSKSRLSKIKAALPTVPIVFLIALLIIWAAYRFSFGYTDLRSYRLPAPELWMGIEAVVKHNVAGHGSYLLGSKTAHGFWYFYPVAFAIKTPAALLILFFFGAWTCLRRRFPVSEPLFLAIGIVAFSMLFSNINIGLRHILPVYVGLAVALGVCLSAYLQSQPSKWIAAAIYLCLALTLLSGALKHPNYIAYTNEFFWKHPEQALVDSDVDWGQDMKRLADRMKQLHVRSLYFDPFNRGYLRSHPFPEIQHIPDGNTPPQGWTAVSVTAWKLGGGPQWLNTMTPTEKIGNSILLFHRN